MALLRTVVCFLIAQAIGFGLVIWCTVEMEDQNTSQVKHGLQVLVGYNAVVMLLLFALLAWAGIRAHRKANTVLVVEAQSTDMEAVVGKEGGV